MSTILMTEEAVKTELKRVLARVWSKFSDDDVKRMVSEILAEFAKD